MFKKWIFIIIAVFMLLYALSFATGYRPVLSYSLKNITIVIDAGHGYPDSGATANNITEKDLNLSIAKKLKQKLENKGASVIMTRTSDKSLSDAKTNNKSEDMKKRRAIRDNKRTDIFVSIHMNHFDDSRYRGAQVFYNMHTPKSKELAKCIQNCLRSKVDPANYRQIKQDTSLYILKNSTKPSVLVECGFLSNPKEALKLKDDKYQEKLAAAIAEGIADFLKSNEKH